MNQILLNLLIIYLLSLPFGQLLRVPTPYPEINIHLTDIIIGITFLAWLSGFLISIIQKLLKKYFSIKITNYQLLITNYKTKLNKPIAIFTIVALISLLKGITTQPFKETLAASLYLFRWVTYASLFPITILLTKSKKNLHQITKALTISFILIVLFGIIQYLWLPDLRFLYSQGWDDHYYRLTGTFLDPGFTGIILLIGLMFIFQKTIKLSFAHPGGVIPFIIKYKSLPRGELPKVKNFQLKFFKFPYDKLPNYLNYLLITITYITIALTYSRASYLALITTGLILIWIKKSFKLLILLGVILIFTWILLPRPTGAGGNLARTSTINYRITNWQQSLQVIKNHPLLGVGFNRYRYTQRNYQFLPQNKWQTSHSAAGVDNSFLFVLATTGIIGFTAYAWFWIAALKTVCPQIGPSSRTITKLTARNSAKGNIAKKISHQHLTQTQNVKKLSTFTTLIAILIHSQFHNTLFYPPVMALTWITLALNLQQSET